MEVSQNGCDPSALLAKLHIHKTPTSNKSTPNKAVNFTINPDGEKKREKYLTAKYGAHQMALIRKRLKVEMWMFDQLQEICESEVSKVRVITIIAYNVISFQTESSNEVDIDLDEVLDIEDESKRKDFIRVSTNLLFYQIISSSQDILTDSKSSKEVINVGFSLPL